MPEGNWSSPGDSFDCGGRAPWWRWTRAFWRRRERPPFRPAFQLPATDDVDFPVYVVDGSTAELAGHGWDSRGVHSVKMRQAGIMTTTRALRRAFTDTDHENTHALASVLHNIDPVRWLSRLFYVRRTLVLQDANTPSEVCQSPSWLCWVQVLPLLRVAVTTSSPAGKSPS